MQNSAFNEINKEEFVNNLEHLNYSEDIITQLLADTNDSPKNNIRQCQYFIKNFAQITNIEHIILITSSLAKNIEILGSLLPQAVQIIKQQFQLSPSQRLSIINILSLKLQGKASMLILHILKQLSVIPNADSAKSLEFSEQIKKLNVEQNEVSSYISKNWNFLKIFYLESTIKYRFKEKIQFTPEVYPEIIGFYLSSSIKIYLKENFDKAYQLSILQLNPFLECQFDSEDEQNVNEVLQNLIDFGLSKLKQEYIASIINFLNVVIIYHKEKISIIQRQDILNLIFQNNNNTNYIPLLDCLFVQFFDETNTLLIKNSLNDKYVRYISIALIVYYQFDIKISSNFNNSFVKIVKPNISYLMDYNEHSFLMFNKVKQVSYYFWEEFVQNIFSQNNILKIKQFIDIDPSNIFLQSFIDEMLLENKPLLPEKQNIQKEDDILQKENYRNLMSLLQQEPQKLQLHLENIVQNQQIQILDFIYFILNDKELNKEILFLIKNSGKLIKIYDNIILYQGKQRNFTTIQLVFDYYIKNIYDSSNKDSFESVYNYVKVIERYFSFGWLIFIQSIENCQNMTNNVMVFLFNSIVSYLQQVYQDINILEIIFYNKIPKCKISAIVILILFQLQGLTTAQKVDIKDVQLYEFQSKYSTLPDINEYFLQTIQITQVQQFHKYAFQFIYENIEQMKKYHKNYTFILSIIMQVKQIAQQTGIIQQHSILKNKPIQEESPHPKRSLSQSKSKPQISIINNKKPNQSYISYFIQEFNKIHDIKEKLGFLQLFQSEIQSDNQIFRIDQDFCSFSLKFLKIQTNQSLIQQYLQTLQFIYESSFQNKQILIKATIDDIITLFSSTKKSLRFYSTACANAILAQEQLFHADFTIKNNYFASALISALKNTTLQSAVFSYIHQFVLPNIDPDANFNEFAKKIYKFARDNLGNGKSLEIISEIERIFPQSKGVKQPGSRPGTPKRVESSRGVIIKSRPATPVNREVKESKVQSVVKQVKIEPKLSIQQQFDARQTKNDLYVKWAENDLWAILIENQLVQTGQKSVPNLLEQTTENFEKFQFVLDIICFLVQIQSEKSLITQFLKLFKIVRISNLNYCAYLQKIITQTLIILNEFSDEDLRETILLNSSFIDVQFLLFSFEFYSQQKTIDVLFELGDRIVGNDKSIIQILVLMLVEKNCENISVKQHIIEQAANILQLTDYQSYENVFNEKAQEIFDLLNQVQFNAFEIFPMLQTMDLAVSGIFKELGDQLEKELVNSQIQPQNYVENTEQLEIIQQLADLASDLSITDIFTQKLQNFIGANYTIPAKNDTISSFLIKILSKIVKFHHDQFSEIQLIIMLQKLQFQPSILEIQQFLQLIQDAEILPLIQSFLINSTTNFDLLQLIQPILNFSTQFYNITPQKDFAFLKIIIVKASSVQRTRVMENANLSYVMHIFRAIQENLDNLDQIPFKNSIAIHPLTLAKFIVQEFKFCYLGNEERFVDVDDIIVWLM